MNKGDQEMIGVLRNKRMLATLLSVAIILASFGSLSVSAQRRYSGRYYRPHHSRTKGALIGGAIGGIGGALIGGGKGALIGAGAGAGTGYLIQRHRNHKHYRHYRRY
jgi:osmotically inducible lipoprotein OsmB